MGKKFRVILLVEEKPQSFVVRFHSRYAKTRGDALLDVLCSYAGTGADLNGVRKTRVTEIEAKPTLLGLHAI